MADKSSLPLILKVLLRPSAPAASSSFFMPPSKSPLWPHRAHTLQSPTAAHAVTASEEEGGYCEDSQVGLLRSPMTVSWAWWGGGEADTLSSSKSGEVDEGGSSAELPVTATKAPFKGLTKWVRAV